MIDPTQEIEIDTDGNEFLSVYNAGSTIVIEVWSIDAQTMKEEIRLTKGQANLLVKTLQEIM